MVQSRSAGIIQRPQEELLKETEELRIQASKRILNEHCVEVQRDTLYEDLITLYQKRTALTSKLLISFCGEAEP